MAEKAKSNRGLLIFMALVIFCIVVGGIAYLITGNKGIEERFSQAVGLAPAQGGNESSLFGFSIEGNVVVYAAILVLLIIVCFVLIKKFKL